MIVKELIDKLQQFNGDKLVLVEDTEYKEFQAIDVEPVDDRFVIITTMLVLIMLELKLKIKFGKVLDLFFNGLNMD